MLWSWLLIWNAPKVTVDNLKNFWIFYCHKEKKQHTTALYSMACIINPQIRNTWAFIIYQTETVLFAFTKPSFQSKVSSKSEPWRRGTTRHPIIQFPNEQFQFLKTEIKTIKHAKVKWCDQPKFNSLLIAMSFMKYLLKCCVHGKV